MLIPIYVLVGVWGGPDRITATVTFVIYTMAGSLLMLASIVAFGLSQGTFSLIDVGHERQRLGLPRLPRRLRGQGAAAAVPRLAARPRTPRRRPRWRRSSRASSRRPRCSGSSGSCCRTSPSRSRTCATVVLVLAAATLVYGSLLAFRQPDVRGVIAYSSMAPDGPDRARHLRGERPRPRRRRPALGQPRPRLGGDVPARRDVIERVPAPIASPSSAGSRRAARRSRRS